MFCEDLSPYHYSFPTGLPGTYNIGWLDRGCAFQTGRVQDQIVGKIFDFAGNPIFLTRGVHNCHLCTSSETFTGNGELWMRSGSGPIYVAPQMLPHYLEEHRYLPPAQFLEIFDRKVEMVSEDECCELIARQAKRLLNNPARTDILIDLFEMQVFWRVQTFKDLVEFQKYVDWHQGPGECQSSQEMAKQEDGYRLCVECRDPVEKYATIRHRFETKPHMPYMYRYRLMYLNEPWTEVVSK